MMNVETGLESWRRVEMRNMTSLLCTLQHPDLRTEWRYLRVSVHSHMPRWAGLLDGEMTRLMGENIESPEQRLSETRTLDYSPKSGQMKGGSVMRLAEGMSYRYLCGICIHRNYSSNCLPQESQAASRTVIYPAREFQSHPLPEQGCMVVGMNASEIALAEVMLDIKPLVCQSLPNQNIQSPWRRQDIDASFFPQPGVWLRCWSYTASILWVTSETKYKKLEGRDGRKEWWRSAGMETAEPPECLWL